MINSDPLITPMLISRCTRWWMAAPDTLHSRATSRYGILALCVINCRIFLSSVSICKLLSFSTVRVFNILTAYSPSVCFFSCENSVLYLFRQYYGAKNDCKIFVCVDFLVRIIKVKSLIVLLVGDK